MPTSSYPKDIEARDKYISGQNINPFTGQQQGYDWGTRYKKASVSYASLKQSQADDLIAFLEALDGQINAFEFPAAMLAKYPETLTTDGTTPRQWKLMGSEVAWMIGPGAIYRGVTFEIREAI